MPVEMLSLVSPEFFRVFETVSQDFILDMAAFVRHAGEVETGVEVNAGMLRNWGVGE